MSNKTDAIRAIEKIDEATHDGMAGSASYAQDRLILIRKLAGIALRNIRAMDDGHLSGDDLRSANG